MVAGMAKRTARAETPPPRPDDQNVTTVKAYKRLARMITQLASLRDENQQDVLNRYSKQIEEDLLAELANRQTEIRGSRKDS